MSGFHEQFLRDKLSLGGECLLPGSQASIAEPTPTSTPTHAPIPEAPSKLPSVRPEGHISSLDISPETLEIIRRNREASGQQASTPNSSETDFKFQIEGKGDRIRFEGDIPNGMHSQIMGRIFGSPAVSETPPVVKPRSISQTPQPLAIEAPSQSGTDISERLRSASLKVAKLTGTMLRARNELAGRRSSLLANVAGGCIVASLCWGVGSSTEVGLVSGVHVDKSEAVSHSFDGVRLVGRLLP